MDSTAVLPHGLGQLRRFLLSLCALRDGPTDFGVRIGIGSVAGPLLRLSLSVWIMSPTHPSLVRRPDYGIPPSTTLL
jgi:hypothetical protein